MSLVAGKCNKAMQCVFFFFNCGKLKRLHAVCEVSILRVYIHILRGEKAKENQHNLTDPRVSVIPTQEFSGKECIKVTLQSDSSSFG